MAMIATLQMIILGILTNQNIFNELVIFIDHSSKVLQVYGQYQLSLYLYFSSNGYEFSRTSFAKLKPDTNDISFRVTKDINFPNIFALGRKKLI